MVKKKPVLMEHIWLVISVMCLVFFVYNVIKIGFTESYILLIFSVISILMYLWRKALRKKDEQENS